MIAGYPGDKISLVLRSHIPITDIGPRRLRAADSGPQCWHCSDQSSMQHVARDAVFADLEIEPISSAEEVQIYQAVMSGRPVRPGLVARLWRHAQLWRS